MNNCVNINSQEFKDLVNKVEYAPSVVELAIKEMQAQRNNPDFFPTVSELKKAIQPVHFVSDSYVDASGKATMSAKDRVWLEQYQTPYVSGNLQLIREAEDKALEIFPRGSVKVIELKDGRYKLEVASPDWLPFSLNSNLFNEIQEFIENRDTPGAELLRTIIKALGNNMPKVTLIPTRRKFTWKDGTGKEQQGEATMAANAEELLIYLPRLYEYLISSDRNITRARNMFLSVISHELLHSFTVDAVRNVEKGIATRAEQIFYNEIERLRNLAIQQLGEEASKIYGLSNTYEFIAEVPVNSSLQRKLLSIEDPNSKQKNKFSIWDKVVRVYRTLIKDKYNIDTKASVYDSAMQAIASYTEYTNVRREKAAIKERALRDGTFMKAPNGENTNLSEDQWLTVRTANFKEWFGDWENDPENSSKVIDENGEPLVVYHGSNFENDEVSNGNWSKNVLPYATYFSVKPYQAGFSHYEEVFLNLRNPIFDTADLTEDAIQDEELFNKLIKDKGYDGAITFRERLDKYDKSNILNSQEIVAINPNQIKSATNNIGTFDNEINNIFEEGERQTKAGTQDKRLLSLGKKDRVLINNKEEEKSAIHNLLDIIRDSEYSPIVSLLDKLGVLEELDKVKVELIDVESARQDYHRRNNKILNDFEGKRAYYNANNNTIYINYTAKFADGNAASVIMHELLHPLTIARINSRPEFRQQIQDIINEYLQKEGNYNVRYDSRNPNGHHIEEFIADIWSNPETIKRLKETEAKDNKHKTLWDKFKSFFEGLWAGAFKGTKDTSLMAKASSLLINILETQPTVEAEGLYAEGMSDTNEGLTIEDLLGPSENTNQKEQGEKNTIDPYVAQQIIITKQLDSLLKDKTFSAAEIQDIAEQVVYWVSDHITELQSKPEKAVTYYGEEFKGIDFSSMSRADVVKKIGAQNIINRCKEEFSAENNNFTSLKLIRKSHKITDNWNAIMTLAQNTFLEVEDFSMNIGLDGKAVDVITELNLDADNFNDSQDEASIKEMEGNLQEHWQIETKTIDILKSMSQRVKQALRQCYKTDKDGNIDTSEWGIQRRLNVREATNSILRWTQGARSLEDMIAKLQEKQTDNPWVKQLLDRLNDKSGQETSFQSEFYGTFQKHFQPYSIVINEKGTFKSIPVNENPALTEAMTQVTTLFKIGEHPLFDSKGINKSAYDQFKAEFDSLDEFSRNVDFTDPKVKEDIANSLGFISNLFGYYVTPEMVEVNLNAETFKNMYSALFYINRALSNNLDNTSYNPFNFRDKSGISGNMREFLKPITEHLEDTAISAFYDSGKMYQSYITPSYTTKLMQKFQLTGQEFDDFIQEEFGKYDWFKFQDSDDIERGWRNSWLRLLVTDKNAREVFKHKTQLNFNKKNYMKNMTDSEYCLSLLAEYFSESDNKEGSRVPAWFRIPMLSNKPSSEFIRFYSERGSNYQDTILDGMLDIMAQELSRIQTVRMRNLDKSSTRYINNFDKNGRKFCFLQSLNDYLDNGKLANTQLGGLLNAKINGGNVNSAKLNALAKEALRATINERVESILTEWSNQGILEAAKKIKNVGETNEAVIESLRNFIWNDTFASMNIIQMFITDIAFYKNAEDLQKRLAQIHAPGIRGNVHATDFEGNPVTDGISRTFYVKDFDSFISNIIDNVSVVFDRKIAQSTTQQEAEGYRALKESLVGNDGAYRKINVTDAQAYNSLTSYRKKALIFGKWSKEAEAIYEKLRKGEYTYSDLQVAFQPLKPFVYSQITKDMGVPNAPITTAKVPVQNKNSEYLLILADALLQGENTGRPNILRAISEVMEESHYDAQGNYKLDGIDTVQFESTVKSGLEGAIDLNPYLNMENGEAMAKAAIRSHIYQIEKKQVKETDAEGNTTTRDIYTRTENYNKDTVHEISYEDYCLQQEVPEHFKDHSQIHGSQLRYIVVSELAETTFNGEPARYEIKDPASSSSKEGRKVSAKEFKEEYERTIANNIEESINKLASELNLDPIHFGTTDPKARNIALSKILQREILSSPRYGVDLLLACSVDANGKFRIPLGDPIQSKRVEQLINSIIKNRINKQQIAGGPVVQVSNFGTSRQLNIRFKDKNGNLLQTRNQFKGTDEEFKKYLKDNQAGIAYFEVFAPIYTNSLFTRFADKNGNINIQAIEALEPDLLKMIGYRIPTEAKYSMAPLKIVGFLPREAGDGIMLPYDITLLTGSDFDVDKEYLMRPDYEVRKNKDVNMFQILYDDLVSSQKGKPTWQLRNQLNDLIRLFLSDPFDKNLIVDGKTDNASGNSLRISERAYNRLLRTYMTNAYSVVRDNSGTKYRNNKIINMTYEVLSHETSCAEMLNPGGFDPQKKMGYMVNVFKDPSNHYSWEALQEMSIDELKDLSNKSKNLSFIDTQIQFYKQNSAAGSLIGIFAVNRTAHAVIEGEGYMIDVDATCRLDRPFEVAGITFGGLMDIDVRTNRAGESVGKVLGSLVASSVDAVKDPVLNLMNINRDTANILNTLIRMGMPFEDAALFLSQSAISKALQEYTSKNISGRTSLNKVIRDRIAEIEKNDGYGADSEIQKEPLTREELIDGLKTDDIRIEYKVLKAFVNFSSLANALRMPTFATRYNSIASAVGPLIIDNLMQEYQADDLSLGSTIYNSERQKIDMQDLMLAHPILAKFSTANAIANSLFHNMPANSMGFRNILNVLTARDSEGQKNYLGQLLIKNKKLLSALSDFYQSYLAVAGGIVDASHLEYAIKVFPNEFIQNNIKDKYKDNYLIQSIKYDIDRNNRTILKLDTVGLDETVKQKLQSAWLDLHNQDPELSKKLFEYCFFRGGMGFSPKAFMNLVPLQVKEVLPNYIDTYRVLPTTEPWNIIDQFVRNNCGNDELVPIKNARAIDLVLNNDGYYLVTNEEAVKTMRRMPFFKIETGENTYKVFKQVAASKQIVTYKEISPLGDNKSYLEIDTNAIDKALEETLELDIDLDSNEIEEDSHDTIPETEVETTEAITAAEKEREINVAFNAAQLAALISSEASTMVEEYKASSHEGEKSALELQIKGLIEDKFNLIGIEYNETLINEIFKELC